MHVRNPVEWGVDQLKQAGATIDMIGRGRHLRDAEAQPLAVQRIGVGDLREALARGFDDFLALRSDVVFLCLIYPASGFILARLVFGYDLLPLLFPLASGFALIGPVAAVGLYEMSRRREAGVEVGWADAFQVVRNPGFGSILLFGLLLLAIFLCWLTTASLIYNVTLGPQPPASPATFARDLATTRAGWILIGGGIGGAGNLNLGSSSIGVGHLNTSQTYSGQISANAGAGSWPSCGAAPTRPPPSTPTPSPAWWTTGSPRSTGLSPASPDPGGQRAGARARKFSRSLWPPSVRIDSGWNWTPTTGSSRWRRPMTTPSSVSAVISRQSGTESRSTTSEWYRVASNGSGRPAKRPSPEWLIIDVLPCIT